LGEASLSFVESDGAEASVVAKLDVFTVALAKDVPYGDVRGVDREDDGRVACVVDR